MIETAQREPGRFSMDMHLIAGRGWMGNLVLPDFSYCFAKLGSTCLEGGAGQRFILGSGPYIGVQENIYADSEWGWSPYARLGAITPISRSWNVGLFGRAGYSLIGGAFHSSKSLLESRKEYLDKGFSWGLGTLFRVELGKGRALRNTRQSLKEQLGEIAAGIEEGENFNPLPFDSVYQTPRRNH